LCAASASKKAAFAAARRARLRARLRRRRALTRFHMEVGGLDRRCRVDASCSTCGWRPWQQCAHTTQYGLRRHRDARCERVCHSDGAHRAGRQSTRGRTGKKSGNRTFASTFAVASFTALPLSAPCVLLGLQQSSGGSGGPREARGGEATALSALAATDMQEPMGVLRCIARKSRTAWQRRPGFMSNLCDYGWCGRR